MMLLIAAGCSCQKPNITWSWGPVVPIPKTSWATAVVGDSIATIGGSSWVTTPEGKDVKKYIDDVYILNVEEMQWKQLPDYPINMSTGFAAFVDNKLYGIGGKNSHQAHDKVFILDLSQKNPKWRPGPSLHQPRVGHKGAVIGETIYVIGGNALKSGASPALPIMALDTRHLEKGWQHIADMPAPQTKSLLATACGNKLYLFGGVIDLGYPPRKIDGNVFRIAETVFLPLTPQAQSFSLDLATLKWKEIRPLPTPKSYAECKALDDRYIITVGGVDTILAADQTPDKRPRISVSNQCWLYDTQKDTYQPLTPLPKATCDHGLVLIDDKIYVIGGEGTVFRTRLDVVQIGKIR